MEVLGEAAVLPGVFDVSGGVFGDIIADGSEGSHFLRSFVADLDAKFFFDGHERFDNVEGIKAEIVV